MASFANMPLKERLNTEKARLREMTFKEKMQHIWEYYKIHLIVIVVILIVIGSFVNIWFINPRPKTVLFIAWSAGFALDEQTTGLADVLTGELVENKRKEAVEVSLFLTDSSDPQMEMANTMRMTAMIAAGMLDVFILTDELVAEFSQNGAIQPLDAILAELKSADPALYAEIEDSIAYGMYTTEEGSSGERMMGIDISNSPIISELAFYSEQGLWFCVTANSGNLDNIVPALIVLLGSA